MLIFFVWILLEHFEKKSRQIRKKTQVNLTQNSVIVYLKRNTFIKLCSFDRIWQNIGAKLDLFTKLKPIFEKLKEFEDKFKVLFRTQLELA